MLILNLRNAINSGMIFGVEILVLSEVSHNLKCEIISYQKVNVRLTLLLFVRSKIDCAIHMCDNWKINNLIFIMALKIQQRVNCDENETFFKVTKDF